MIILLTVLVWSLPISAQAVQYGYDVVGNRISRSRVVNMSFTAQSISEVDREKTKLEEDILDAKIIIYPNPTKGILRVDISGIVIPETSKITVYDMRGEVIRKLMPISESNLIDISSQPAGILLMRIHLDKSHTTTWKIIKE